MSIPASATGNRREKSHLNLILRSKSQPIVENQNRFLLSPSPSMNHPMKNFFGNLLQLTPHRYMSPAMTSANRSKISSSLSTVVPSDRSSRIKHTHPSVVSSFSIRSTNLHSPSETRLPPTTLTIKFRRAGKIILFAIYWCNFARKKYEWNNRKRRKYTFPFL